MLFLIDEKKRKGREGTTAATGKRRKRRKGREGRKGKEEAFGLSSIIPLLSTIAVCLFVCLLFEKGQAGGRGIRRKAWESLLSNGLEEEEERRRESKRRKEEWWQMQAR